MNYVLLLNALLGLTVLVGFFARYIAVLTHRTARTAVQRGRLGLVYLVLDTMLATLAKYV